MGEELSGKWANRFGSGLPEWVGQLHELQDVDNAIGDCRRRIDEFKKRLEEETFLLEWLESRSGLGTIKEARTPPDDQQQLEEDSPTQPQITRAFESLDRFPDSEAPRRRVNEQVDRTDVNLVEKVKRKIKTSGKYLSISGIDSVLSQAPVIRKRSFSESSMVQAREGKYKHKSNKKLPTLSPIKDKESPPINRYAPYKITTPTKQPPSLDSSINTIPPPVAAAMTTMEGKRLSNGIHVGVYKGEESEEDDLLASVKTVVSPDDIGKDHNKWAESSGTLKRGHTTEDFRTSLVMDEKTPTGSLDASGEILESGSALEQGLTLNMVDHARSQSFELPIKLDQVASFVSRSLDEQEFDTCINKDSTGSMGDLQSDSYNNYHDLAESTLTYILRDTIFATSRSNSVSSLPSGERLSRSPEPITPMGVNLRPNSGKRRDRNRDAQLLDNFSDDETINVDEERLQQMLAEIQEPYHSSSPSSEQSYSDPSSPTHLVTWDINQVSRIATVLYCSPDSLCFTLSLVYQ